MLLPGARTGGSLYGARGRCRGLGSLFAAAGRALRQRGQHGGGGPAHPPPPPCGVHALAHQRWDTGRCLSTPAARLGCWRPRQLLAACEQGRPRTLEQRFCKASFLQYLEISLKYFYSSAAQSEDVSRSQSHVFKLVLTCASLSEGATSHRHTRVITSRSPCTVRGLSASTVTMFCIIRKSANDHNIGESHSREQTAHAGNIQVTPPSLPSFPINKELKCRLSQRGFMFGWLSCREVR